ncbi:hypothetical protein LguiB_034083 [Lonicera macranthoides]
MLVVFEKAIGHPPEELSLPSAGRPGLRTRAEIAEIFWSCSRTRPCTTSQMGILWACHMSVKVQPIEGLNLASPLPAGDGEFKLSLLSSLTMKGQMDGDGCVQLHWGMAGDGSLVCSDDLKIMTEACGKCYAPFPPGCIFTSGNGLNSFDHPLHKVRGIAREDGEGEICAVIFQVELYMRLHSIPCTGSSANWADSTPVEGE